VIEKVQRDKAFITGLIKAENLQEKTHCDIEKMRAKERKISVSRYFRSIQ
jgi:hypothetical protein